MILYIQKIFKKEVLILRRNHRGNRKFKKSNYQISDKKTIKNLTFVVLFLFIILIGVIIFYAFRNTNSSQSFLEVSSEHSNLNSSIDNSENNIQEEKQEETDSTFTMTAIGDIMCHNTQYWDAYDKNTDEYDFSYVFEDIYRYIKSSDIAIGSLETTFAGAERGYSSYPTFNTPDNLAYCLKKIGIDVLSTAGNHALDTGFSGLSRTIDILDKADISHVGTYQTRRKS